LPFKLHSSLIAAVLAASAFAGSALAQDSSGTIQLHMPGQAIHLHMPGQHHVAKHKPRAAAAPAAEPVGQNAEATSIPFGSDEAAAPAPPPAKHVKAPVREASVPAKATSRAERRKAVQAVLASPPKPDGAQGDAGIPFSFDSDESPAPAKPKPAPERASPPSKLRASAAAHPHAQLAALQPMPKQVAPAPAKPRVDTHAGLAKQGEVLFPTGATDPEADSASNLKTMAVSLNSTLDSQASAGVEIDAYGGPPGNKSSDARRLSLRRALAVRQMLIDGGIPSGRIIVRALGGVDDQGNPDRVDVYLRAAG
jgi:outer membrane protein OmpA-like peptidoglycan-associated protein